jgi:hypothetical protein
LKLLRRLRRLWLRFTCPHEWTSSVHGELGVIYVTQSCRLCGVERAQSQL